MSRLGTSHHMIEVACEDIDNDAELTRVFNQCVLDTGVDTSPAVVSRLYSELSKKINFMQE